MPQVKISGSYSYCHALNGQLPFDPPFATEWRISCLGDKLGAILMTFTSRHSLT